MDFKGLLSLVANPMLLAGLGGYLGYRYGKKASISNKYIGGGVGLGAGYLIGKSLQKVVTPAPAQLPPQAVDTEQPPLSDYVNLDFDAPGMPPMALPAPRIPQFDTSPANISEGEGSYNRTSYDVSGVEAAMDEAELFIASKRNGSN